MTTRSSRIHSLITLPLTSCRSHYPEANIMIGLSHAGCLHLRSPLLTSHRMHMHAVPFAQLTRPQNQQKSRHQRTHPICCETSNERGFTSNLSPLVASSTVMWLLSQLPVQAEGTDFSQGSFSKESYYVTLGLFLLSVPGRHELGQAAAAQM